MSADLNNHARHHVEKMKNPGEETEDPGSFPDDIKPRHSFKIIEDISPGEPVSSTDRDIMIFTCVECKQNFTTNMDLQDHNETHMGVNPAIR